MDQTPYTPPPGAVPPQYGYQYGEKPGKVQTIAVLTLVSGITNILWALGVTVMVVVGTIGIGLLCAPLTLLPLVLGIFEIIFAMKLMANPPQPVKPSQTLAILEIVMIIGGNLVSVAAGILALVFYNEPEVKAYFAQMGG